MDLCFRMLSLEPQQERRERREAETMETSSEVTAGQAPERGEMVQGGGSLVRWHCLQPVAGDKLLCCPGLLCWAQKYLAHLPLFLGDCRSFTAELVRPPEGHL